jgi:non-ribosomal peptide synthetase component F
VPGGAWQVLSSRTLIQNCAQQRSGNYPVLSADDPALILMTSGSTGKPKSVLIAHRGIARLSLPVPALGNSERDCYLQIADVSFAASANEIWMALLTGACLTIAPPGLPDLMALVRQIESDNVTVLFLSGGLFRLFVEFRLKHCIYLIVWWCRAILSTLVYLAWRRRQVKQKYSMD